MDAVLRLVEAGTGVAVVPDLVFAGRPRLRRTVLTPPLYRTVALARRADLAPTQAVHAFQDTLLRVPGRPGGRGRVARGRAGAATTRSVASIYPAIVAVPTPAGRDCGPIRSSVVTRVGVRRAPRRRRRARRAPPGPPGTRCRRRSPCGRACRPGAGRPRRARPRWRRPASAACGRRARAPAASSASASISASASPATSSATPLRRSSTAMARRPSPRTRAGTGPTDRRTRRRR